MSNKKGLINNLVYEEGILKLSLKQLAELLASHPDAGEYLERLIGVVRSLGSSEFEGELLVFLSNLVPIDHCVVFTYSDNGEAGHLFTHSRMSKRVCEKLARDYVEKYHQQDPNYASIQDDNKGEYYCLERFIPSKDTDSFYQDYFFNRIGLIDKASSVGRIEGGKVYCNFYRMENSSIYSKKEWKLLGDLMPLATAFIAAHYELAKARGMAFMDNGSENIINKSIVHNAISTEKSPFDKLTKRERQVCERIILGYTTIGIGLELDIAPTSVATYRKRAYSKLFISSQNELFALCFRNIKH